jgi:tellurium resistance protein TerD
MAINLVKGQAINLSKEEYDLSSLTIGLGWKVRTPPAKGFFGGLFGGNASEEEDYDLDAIAFLLDENSKVKTLGDKNLLGGDVVFFNSPQHPSGDVVHSGDNRVGGTGAQDDEQIQVRLASLDRRYHRILFLVSIYKGQERGQHFGMVQDAYIRAIDANGHEIARYSLSHDSNYADRCTVVFGEVYRRDAGWRFRAIGDGYPFDSFVHLLKQHVPEQ